MRDKAIYDPTYRALITRLTQHRKAKGITQAQLSERIGIPRYDVSKVENFVRELGMMEVDAWLEGLELHGDVVAFIQGKVASP
jgi:transcriptional regulator with XRE-family HTH domain